MSEKGEVQAAMPLAQAAAFLGAWSSLSAFASFVVYALGYLPCAIS